VLQRFVLRTRNTPLRAIWGLLQWACARLAVACLVWGERGASAYSDGRLVPAEFNPGLSDVDLVILLKAQSDPRDVAAGRVRRRWQRLGRLFPMVDLPRVYEEADLRELVGSSVLTYGLDSPGGERSHVRESEGFDRLRLLLRPGLHTTVGDWHRLAGPERRLAEPDCDPQQQRIAAWLELVFWWRILFRAVIEANEPRPSDVCIKCIAEALRILVWLAHGERIDGRVQALRRGLELLPEEEDGLRRILELRRSLDPSTLAEGLPLLGRLSNRVAALIDAEGRAAGFTHVRVAGDTSCELILAEGGWKRSRWLGDGGSPAILPLADWRSLAWPTVPDDSFAALEADPLDASVLRAAVTVSHGPYPTLLAGRVLIRPGQPLARTRMRAVGCRTTDPVSFALLEGAEAAAFPNLRGWSAADTARRGVAEHQAWLHTRARSPDASDGGRELGALLSAARSAQFLDSITAGRPELSLTLTETARTLSDHLGTAGALAEHALDEYRSFARSGAQPRAKTIRAMRKLVLGLDPYASVET
jgi:hypothetical protein